MDNNGTYKYSAYGLNIVSPIPLPELLPSAHDPDVRIGFGNVPLSLDEVKEEGVCYQANHSTLLLLINGVARFLVSGGNEIVIEPHPDCDEDSLRLFLLDAAFGALLHQKGFLVLHGSAIKTGDLCICLAGATGTGKSTIAGAFMKRGYRLLTDDICPVTTKNGGAPFVLPAYPVLKLWFNSLHKLGEDPKAYYPVRPTLKKYGMPVIDHFHDKPLLLTHIYVINTSNRDGVELTPVEGFHKLSVLNNQTYRFHYIKGLGVHKSHFKHCTNLGKVVKMSHITRPQIPFMTDEIVDVIENDFKK